MIYENPQEYLNRTLESNGDVIEFITHQDGDKWIYFNGSKTDVKFPLDKKNKNFKRMRPYNIYKHLRYGVSEYNKKRIKRFFMNLVPEEFL